MSTMPATTVSPEELHQNILNKECHLGSFETFNDEHFSYVSAETGQTLLHALAMHGTRNHYDWLVRQNGGKNQDAPEGRVFSQVYIDALDNDGFTALMRCQQRLSDPDGKDEDQNVALRLYELLLQNGADYAAHIPNSLTPMEAALRDYHQQEQPKLLAKLITLLVEHDADFPDGEFPAVLTCALRAPRKKTLGILAERLDGNSDLMKSYLGGDYFFENLVLLSLERTERSRPLFMGFDPKIDGVRGSLRSVFEAAHELGISLLGRNAHGRTLHEVAVELGLNSFYPGPCEEFFATKSLHEVLRLQTRELIPPLARG